MGLDKINIIVPVSYVSCGSKYVGGLNEFRQNKGHKITMCILMCAIVGDVSVCVMLVSTRFTET